MTSEANVGVWRILVEHFLNRFVDNELVSPQGEMQVAVTKILALLAVPGMLIPFYLMPKYTVLAFSPPAVRESASLVDKFFFLSFSMVVMGFVTVLEWEALFPDRRDFVVLMPLPIRGRTIFLAKIAALFGFLAIFAVTTNALSTLLYPVVAMPARGSLLEAGRLMAVHATTIFAGTAFIFLFLIALQGLLMNVLSVRSFKQVSPYVQFLALFALLSVLSLIAESSALLRTLEQPSGAAVYLLPSMWFLGLYETLMGQTNSVFRELAGISMRALATVFLTSAVMYVIGYMRHMQRSLETEEDIVSEPTRLETALTNLADRFAVRHPVERASFYFVGKTMVRSRKHWLYLAAYVGVGFAFVVQGLVGFFSRPVQQSVYQPRPALLSIPLVLSFFVLSGMRYIFTVPAELRANWIFQLTESEHRTECLSGVRKAMIVFAIVPLFASAFVPSVALWGWRVAAIHLIFGVTLSLLLVELFLINFRKVPFTCSYLPGKANITILWVGYWLAFTAFAYTMASLEHWMLQKPVRLALFFGLAFAALRAFAWYRNRLLGEDFVLIYDDQPDPIVRTLDLWHWS